MKPFHFLFFAVVGFVLGFYFEGCSLAYKPDVHDSTINHQSGNKPNVSTDVNLDLRSK